MSDTPTIKRPSRSRKRPAKRATVPTPVEAMAVLAKRGQFGEHGPEQCHADVLDLIDRNGSTPPPIRAGLERGFPGLIAAADMDTADLLAITQGMG